MAPLAQPQLTSAPTETALVAAAREGIQAAFEQLYRQHSGRIHALCLRLSGDADLAEQHTQDAFVLAWRKLPGYRGESRFGTWLHRLTVNVVLDHQRARARRQRRETPLDPWAEADNLPAVRPLAGAAIGMRLDLERALAGLPDRARAAFVLHEVEGYPVREVAALMQVTEGTVKTQLFRARRQLREVLR
jgi:RNA polymerase sigma-70 factor, ECF subfamily